MRRRALAILTLALLPLASCGDDDDGDGGDDAAETSTSAPEEEATSTTSTTDDAEPSESTSTTEAEVAAAVVPGTHGIDVSIEGEGSSFAFGSGDEVADAVEEVLGAPADESDIDECPAGPANAVGWEDVQLTFQEGAFVGWSMGERSELTTADGLEIGSTLQDVRDRYPDVIVIPDSTIGIEIYAESVGLSGLVTEDSPSGAVTDLWAGTVCIFR